MYIEKRCVFLSHASEDRYMYIKPLAKELDKHGISYWLDEAEIGWGQSISEKIYEGIRISQYVIVFLSANFIRKHWPKTELEIALSKELLLNRTVVLPIIIGDPKVVFEEYPFFKDKAYLRWDPNLSLFVEKLQSVIASRMDMALRVFAVTLAPLLDNMPKLFEKELEEDIKRNMEVKIKRLIEGVEYEMKNGTIDEASFLQMFYTFFDEIYKVAEGNLNREKVEYLKNILENVEQVIKKYSRE
ncbi:MAG: toll/interleukin-1 receptor domain-containing protein [Blastocatellia bacterium]